MAQQAAPLVDDGLLLFQIKYWNIISDINYSGEYLASRW